MKVIKSLLLGSAAGLAAMSGAQAADLPVKAKAVEYVKVCSAYGAGFYYIPGTDICLRVGGAIRADYYIHSPAGTGQSWFQNTAAVPINDADTASGFRGRGYLIMDSRANTAYGTLRTYFVGHIAMTTPATAVPAAETVGIDAAFIQFAGFTAGYAPSLWKFAGAYGLNALVGSGDLTGQDQFAYTAQLGNGVSASVAIESAEQRRGYIYGLTSVISITGGVLGALPALSSNYRGVYYPDITANVRVDQAWGAAILTGAIHRVDSAVGTGADGAEKWGYAVGGGLEVKLDSIAPKDRAQIFGSYGKGATGYASAGPTNNRGVIAIVNSASTAGPVGIWADAVDTNGGTAGGLELTKHYAVTGQFQHYWTPMLRSNVGVGYTKLDVNNTAVAQLGGAIALGDSKILNGTLATIWSPVAGLDLGLEVMYYDVKTSNGTAPFGATSADGWAGTFRAQRDF